VRPQHLHALTWMVSVMILVLLGAGVATATSTKASHVVVEQHVEAEQEHAALAGSEADEHTHAGHALHLLGAWAAVLIAGILIAVQRRCGPRSLASLFVGTGVRQHLPIVTAGSRSQTSRLALCVQIC